MNVPYLCGGIFFWILTQYRNSEINETELLSKLLNISKMTKSDLSQNKNFNVYTSRFKSCTDNIFHKLTIILTDGTKYFSDDFVKNKGFDILDETKKFTKKYIDKDCYNPIAQILLDLIVSDESISDDEEFYITWDFWPIKKKELKGLKKICIETLILGVWQYIVVNRAEKNLNGKATYKEWGGEKKNTSKKINYTLVHKFDFIVYSCNDVESLNSTNYSELEISNEKITAITESSSIKSESKDISNNVLDDSDKELLEEFLTDIRSIRWAIEKMNECSNISLTVIMCVGDCNFKWKQRGKVFYFKNDTLKNRVLDLINTLNDFSVCFRRSYNDHQKERSDVLSRLNCLLNSNYFQSNDAVIIMPTIDHKLPKDE